MHSHTAKLVLIVLSAVMFVVVGDTIGKLLTTAGVEPFVVAWSRFVVGAIIVLPFCGLKLSELRFFWRFRVIVRALFITGAISSIITALKTEPIANVFGVFFIGPIISYILAVIFLKEQTSKSQGVLLILGFCGVMLVVRPGFGLTAGIGFALLAGCCYGAYLASTKVIAGEYRPRFLLFSQLLIGSALLTPIGLVSDLSLPGLDLNLTMLLLGSALFSAAGNFLLVIANRMADASLIAPLIYSQLLFATAFGFMIFDDIPDLITAVGLTLILISGFGSLAMKSIKASKVKENTMS